MTTVRRLVALAGAVLFGLGVASTAVPGLSGVVPIEPALAVAGSDYVVVAAIAVVALLASLAALLVRGVTGHRQATPPTPEGVQTGPKFGSAIDEVVDGHTGLRTHLLTDEFDALRSRLREAAMRTAVRHDDRSREAARELVERGEWTDDPEAAAALAGSHGPSPPLDGRLRALLAGETWTQRGLRKAATAVARNADVEPGESR